MKLFLITLTHIVHKDSLVVYLINSIFFAILGLLLFTGHVQAKPISGIGKLQFGMTPSEINSLAGCSDNTNCIYEVLGKNRYFILRYENHSNIKSDHTLSSSSTGSELTHIDIDMGVYTDEWFSELFKTLSSEYSLNYTPTEQEDTRFQKEDHHELIIGFADGHILLKVVRRPFGNLIIRLIYQDAAAAESQRKYWTSNSTP